MLDPSMARVVTAARKPSVETASAVYASPAQRKPTPASSKPFAYWADVWDGRASRSRNRASWAFLVLDHLTIK
jgi:hypothetical protein